MGGIYMSTTLLFRVIVATPKRAFCSVHITVGRHTERCILERMALAGK